MQVMVKQLILFMMLIVPAGLMAQKSSGADSLAAVRMGNDSLVYIKLEQVDVYPRKGRTMNYRRYTRLVAKLRKVYPFAIEAARELEYYNEKYEASDNEREKRKYVRQVEKELFARHEDELKRFTISEGRYLMLLIDRETGNTSFSIIKEIKGGVPALFWQGIAKIFNNDLKEEYDPLYKHYVIEQIVLMIEEENRKNEGE